MTILHVDVLLLLDAGFSLKQGLVRKTHQDQWTKKLHAQPSKGVRGVDLVFEVPEIDDNKIKAFAHVEDASTLAYYRQVLTDNGVPFAVTQ